MLVKIAYLNLPHLYLALPYGVTPLEFRRDLRHQKTGVAGLSYGVVCMILHLAILVQCRLVTDGQTRQTDGWTDGRTVTQQQHIPR